MTNPDMPRLLMVDDDENYCAMVGALLSGRFDISFAHSLRDGIEMIKQCQPNGVLLDLTMPDADADPLKTLARFKQYRTTAAIIVLTGNPDREKHRELIRDTASACLMKDVDDRNREWFVSQISQAILSHESTLPMREYLTRFRTDQT